MTLEDWISVCSNTIAANFKNRNVRVFSNVNRQRRQQGIRRDEIRRWIKELRLAKDPQTSPAVTERVFWMCEPRKSATHHAS